LRLNITLPMIRVASVTKKTASKSKPDVRLRHLPNFDSIGGRDDGVRRLATRAEVARVANTIFERTFSQDQVVGETLARSLDSEGKVP